MSHKLFNKLLNILFISILASQNSDLTFSNLEKPVQTSPSVTPVTISPMQNKFPIVRVLMTFQKYFCYIFTIIHFSTFSPQPTAS